MTIIDGIKIAEKILHSCKTRFIKLASKPTLAIIMVGDNPASLTYIKKKREAGEYVGINVDIHKFKTATQVEIVDLINELNDDNTVTGIIVQLPIPGIDEYIVCNAINPGKDVDGLNSSVLGDLWLSNTPKFIPATVKAIEYVLMEISEMKGIKYDKYIEGKNILIINRSQIIGKPLSALMLSRNATVIIAHSKTKNIDDLISISDIVVSGTGKENFINTQSFKDDSVLIDVGFNKTDKRIFGDVKKNIQCPAIAYLTPVPGGIGPIGVACLIENVIEVASRNPLYLS